MDNAATSFPKPETVADAVYRQIREGVGSAGRGDHQAAHAADTMVWDTRKALAEFFHIIRPEQIAFTMNVTHALNLAAAGYLQPGDHVISTDMEHNALARPLECLRKIGVEWTRIPAAHGLDMEELKGAIRPNTRMVCMLHASNVTGDVYPIAEVGKLCREYGMTFLVDAAQSAGLLDIDVQRDQIDMLAFTGHKSLLGPQGIGGLYVREGLLLKPVITGGTGSFSESLEQPFHMPDRLESGTHNLPGIAGLKNALEFIRQTGRKTLLEKEREHLKKLWEGLTEIPGVKRYGSGDVERMTPVISFTLHQADTLEVGRFLEKESGIISRAGLHCAGMAHQALGTAATGTCRLSPGYFTTEKEIEAVLKAVFAAAKRFR